MRVVLSLGIAIAVWLLAYLVVLVLKRRDATIEDRVTRWAAAHPWLNGLVFASFVLLFGVVVGIWTNRAPGFLPLFAIIALITWLFPGLATKVRRPRS